MTNNVLTEVKTVLHVGCGQPNPENLHRYFRNEQWKEIRLDIDPAVQPDILGDMLDMSAVADASVDAIWSSHNIEHLYAHEVPLALKEFYRVIKPGGFAYLATPNIQEVARHVAEGNLEEPLYVSPSGPVTALDIMYGFGPSIRNGHYFMSHKTAFTEGSLKKKLENAGFIEIQMQVSGLFLWGLGRKSV